jgi:hypothetical protein
VLRLEAWRFHGAGGASPLSISIKKKKERHGAIRKYLLVSFGPADGRHVMYTYSG